MSVISVIILILLFQDSPILENISSLDSLVSENKF